MQSEKLTIKCPFCGKEIERHEFIKDNRREICYCFSCMRDAVKAHNEALDEVKNILK